MSDMLRKQYATGFYRIRAHDDHLLVKGQQIGEKWAERVRAKLFLKWYERYFTEAQK
jgi:hypothetical protein